MYLPTKGFSFLNITERSLPLIHREHYVSEDKKRIMARFFNSAFSFPMLTDFEHDRRQMILRFPHSERQSKISFKILKYKLYFRNLFISIISKKILILFFLIIYKIFRARKWRR